MMQISSSGFNIRGVLLFIIILFTSCVQKSSDEDANSRVAEVKTPVTVTQISEGVLTDTLRFPATSVFLHKSMIRSGVTGYVENMELVAGARVTEGQKIAMMQTKEAQALQGVHNLDSNLNFNGIFSISSNVTGVVTSVLHQTGDYVQEGDPLCEVASQSSLVFLLDVPASTSSSISLNQSCILLMPDQRRYRAMVQRMLPTANASSQTFQYIVTSSVSEPVPESLQVKILIPNNSQKAVVILPRQCILTNETETSFWVMKLMNDTMAVRVDVTKGMETGDQVEIVSPSFYSNDRFLLTGNYGLGDTADVQIKKP